MTEIPTVRSPVARRLMTRLALVGCVFAAVISAGELEIEYQRDYSR